MPATLEQTTIGAEVAQTVVVASVITATVAGPAGPTGATGATGAQGDPGEGVPAGGTAGQVLAKVDGTDYNTEWADQTGGGGGAPTDASYLTLGTNGTLSAERVLTAGDNVTLTDAGAGSTLTVAVPSMPWADVTGAPTTLSGYGITDAASDTELSDHAADTTSVHGIADTSALVLTDDARLTNSRTPTAHASSHATAGSDPLSASDIGAAAASHTHAASDIASGTVATARLGSGTANSTTFLRGDQTWATPTASVADGDKGDVTVSSSGTVWTIDNDAVTYAKIQNVSATDKVLGRSTAGSGDVEEIAFTSAMRSVADDTTMAAMRDTLGIAKELGYAAITADISTTSDTDTDATGLSVTVTVGSLPIMVEFYAGEVYNSVAGKRTNVSLYDSTAAATVHLAIITNVTTGGAATPGWAQVRLTPASGSRTYKVRWRRGDASGTSTIRASSTGPAYIRVYEVQT